MPKGQGHMIELITGVNYFALDAYLKKRQDDFLNTYGDTAFERFEGEDSSLERLIDAVQSVPFLSERKMVVVHDASKNKLLCDSIDRIIDRLLDTTDLLFVDPKIDKRLVFYKTLKKHAKLSSFDELDETATIKWIKEYSQQQGTMITQDVAGYLVSRTGLSQQLLARQVEVLALHSDVITRDNVDLLVEPSSQSTIFDLIDAVLRGEHKRAIELYEDQRKQKVEPQQIIGMMVWQLHVLAILQSSKGKPIELIASESKISPFVLRKSQTLSQKMDHTTLLSIVQKLIAIDSSIKTTNSPVDASMKNLLLSI